jgi:hypothetical protein
VRLVSFLSRNFGHLAGPETTHKIFNILSIHSTLCDRTKGTESIAQKLGALVCMTRMAES